MIEWEDDQDGDRQRVAGRVRDTGRARQAGRPERPIDPNAGPAARFADSLRRLRREKGSPSYREMAAGALFAPSVLSSAASGYAFPSLRVTLAFVRACDGDPTEWRLRWEAAAAALADSTESSNLGPGSWNDSNETVLSAATLPSASRSRSADAQWLPVPAQLPPGCPHFAGRAHEMEWLLKLTDPNGAARAASVVITGPVGVGKSAFALAFAHRAAMRYPDGQIYADLSGCRAAGESPGDLLGRVLCALSLAPGEIPAEPHQRAALYRSVLAARRLLVVLDDAYSEAEVRPLLAAGPSCLVLVTSRRRLAGLDTIRRITLDALSPEDSQALVNAVAGERARMQADATATLSELCDYLPLAVWIAATRLAAHRGWTARHAVKRLRGEASLLDWLSAGDISVRSNLRSAYHALDAASRRAFRRLGCAHDDIDSAYLAGALRISPAEAERLLERLVDGGLLQTSQSSAGYHMPALFTAFAEEVRRAREPDKMPGRPEFAATSPG